VKHANPNLQTTGCSIRLLREALKDHASEWAAIQSIASKIGCSGETLGNWVRQVERDEGGTA